MSAGGWTAATSCGAGPTATADPAAAAGTFRNDLKLNNRSLFPAGGPGMDDVR